MPKAFPDSLVRLLDGETPAALHRCATPGCNGLTLDDFCAVCVTVPRIRAHHCANPSCRRPAFGDARFCSRDQDEMNSLAKNAQERAERRARGNWLEQCWRAFVAWTPTLEQCKRIDHACRVADRVLKTFIVLTAIYFTAVIVRAFLPGGPAWQLTHGGMK